MPNGPSAASGLYSNQLEETGAVTFIDRAAEAGVEAFDQDSSGVCFGDLDNDGDDELYVLGTGEANRLFENQGNGTFTDITAAAGVGGGDRHAIACTMADFNGDGRLDIVVGNSYGPWTHRIPVFGGVDYENNEHNQLFTNQGGNSFVDNSAAAGLENVSNMDLPGTTGAAFTWAIGSADYDLDGDVDIFSMDNQGASINNSGWIRIFDNDGAGNFTDRTVEAGTNVIGGWMGVDFADFNCDGNMDFFATNLGHIGGAPSRPWMGNSDRTFTDVGVGDIVNDPFGWGVSVFDYDNDADDDVIYHGSVDLLTFILSDNPGALLTNTGSCSGIFDYDATAISRDHLTREVQGVAVGDLNEDGFEDIVAVSSFDYEALNQGLLAPIGSPFDATRLLENMFSGRVIPGMAAYIGPQEEDGTPIQNPNGTLSVEISSGDNGNGWAQFDVVGGAGIIGSHNAFAGPTVNRSGIGAVIEFTPHGGSTSMRPVVGGASYASQNALRTSFGLGGATFGTVDVLWPGGVRNRVYGVHSTERVTLPYIPCSIDGDFRNFGQYNRCVGIALNRYRQNGEINIFEQLRLKINAIIAFFDEQY